jgi:hypothetical protein
MESVQKASFIQGFFEKLFRNLHARDRLGFEDLTTEEWGTVMNYLRNIRMSKDLLAAFLKVEVGVGFAVLNFLRDYDWEQRCYFQFSESVV